jgi:hypothetical protein
VLTICLICVQVNGLLSTAFDLGTILPKHEVALFPTDDKAFCFGLFLSAGHYVAEPVISSEVATFSLLDQPFTVPICHKRGAPLSIQDAANLFAYVPRFMLSYVKGGHSLSAPTFSFRHCKLKFGPNWSHVDECGMM